jgi:tRNA-dihydrouridine synthase
MAISLAMAPMEGITDFPCRLWFHLAARPDFLSAPFMRVAKAAPVSEWPKHYCPEAFSPELSKQGMASVIPQVMSDCPQTFSRIAVRMLEHCPYVDLNCGCPAPRAVGRGAGSSLLREPKWFAEFVQEIIQNVEPGRLSIKMRTGFDDTESFSQLCETLSQIPFHHVTVHGRTRANGYQGQARWDLIHFASRNIQAPVWGSGDIVDILSFERAKEQAPQVTGMLIGRGALRHPWLFEQIRTGGEASLISRGALVAALASYGLLHHLYDQNFKGLLQFCGEGHLRGFAGKDEEAWSQIQDRLLGLAALDATHLDVSRFAVARTKMFWGYLRSSLPEPYFAPEIFRCRSLGEMLKVIASIEPDVAEHEGSLPLGYDSRRDWLYAGRGGVA